MAGSFNLGSEVTQQSATEEKMLEAVALNLCNDLVVYDNFAVYALAGNANNENLQEQIRRAKGDARGTKQPVGWTRPFDERTLDTFDMSEITDPYMPDLLRDPDELTALIGGLTFLRGNADMLAKDKYAVPDSIIPLDQKTVQIYSPVGIRMTQALIKSAIDKGVEPVMTSANVSGQPETIHQSTAQAFADQSPDPLMIVVNKNDDQKPDRPRGSYPVITIETNGFNIVRPGCFDPEILRAALFDYPIRLDSNPQPSKYPENILRLSDLPADVQKLKGREFRLGMLAFLGWS